jgi:hypothetical protein
MTRVSGSEGHEESLISHAADFAPMAFCLVMWTEWSKEVCLHVQMYFVTVVMGFREGLGNQLCGAFPTKGCVDSGSALRQQ